MKIVQFKNWKWFYKSHKTNRFKKEKVNSNQLHKRVNIWVIANHVYCVNNKESWFYSLKTKEIKVQT